MTFDILWIDFWLKDKLFGFGILCVKTTEGIRNFFSVYWNDGELLVDLLWFRVYTDFPFSFLHNDETEGDK